MINALLSRNFVVPIYALFPPICLCSKVDHRQFVCFLDVWPHLWLGSQVSSDIISETLGGKTARHFNEEETWSGCKKRCLRCGGGKEALSGGWHKRAQPVLGVTQDIWGWHKRASQVPRPYTREHTVWRVTQDVWGWHKRAPTMTMTMVTTNNMHWPIM